MCRGPLAYGQATATRIFSRFRCAIDDHHTKAFRVHLRRTWRATRGARDAHERRGQRQRQGQNDPHEAVTRRAVRRCAGSCTGGLEISEVTAHVGARARRAQVRTRAMANVVLR
jgi:hypothetical protein